MGGALAIILQLIDLLPAAVQATQQVVSIYQKVKALYDAGKEPTAADWDELDATLKSLTAQLNADPPLTGV